MAEAFAQKSQREVNVSLLIRTHLETSIQLDLVVVPFGRNRLQIRAQRPKPTSHERLTFLSASFWDEGETRFDKGDPAKLPLRRSRRQGSKVVAIQGKQPEARKTTPPQIGSWLLLAELMGGVNAVSQRFQPFVPPISYLRFDSLYNRL